MLWIKSSTIESAMKTLFASALLLLSASSVLAADDAAKQHAADFATRAAMSNLFEIEAAKVEVANGKASDAKQFAEDMLKDHGKAGPFLADAARQDGIEVPTVLDAEHSEKLNALQRSDAANLDQAYLSTQVAAHQEAVELFSNYSKEGPDGQLKNIAAKILPDLRMHLTRIQGLTSK
jgi:putative membrane protein